MPYCTNSKLPVLPKMPKVPKVDFRMIIFVLPFDETLQKWLPVRELLAVTDQYDPSSSLLNR